MSELIDHTRAHYRGSLLGPATGDALGTTLEFCPPGTFTPIDDIVGGGPFRLNPGEWTDDTSMALCLAESLIECRGFDPVDQLDRYVRWWRDGHLSSNGRCFDIGNSVRAALARFERRREPWCGSTAPDTAGNGSLMRLAPVVLAYAHDPALAVRRAADSSRTTHAAREAVDACRWFAIVLLRALDPRASKTRILSASLSDVEKRALGDEPLAPRIAEVAAGSFAGKEPPHVTGEGYVVRSLEAALWAFLRADSFRDGALLAVNLGDDADTAGAIYGQLAGAFHGEQGIPAEWRGRLVRRELIESFGDRLLQLRARSPLMSANGEAAPRRWHSRTILSAVPVGNEGFELSGPVLAGRLMRAMSGSKDTEETMGQPSIPDPPGFSELTKEEQIRYLEALWDRIADQPGELPIPERHLALAAERLAAYRRDPDRAGSALEVVDRLTKRSK